MKFLFLILLVFNINNSYALECEPPIVNMNILSSPYDIDNNASINTMTKHVGKVYSSIVGLYRTNAQLSIRPEVRTRVYPNGYTFNCLTKLDITYSYSQAINIGSEFPPDSCAYRETLVHETTHAHIQAEKAELAKNYIISELSKKSVSFEGSDLTKFKNWQNETFKFADNTLKYYIEPAQHAFDSPQEYQKLSRSCPQDMIKINKIKQGSNR